MSISSSSSATASSFLSPSYVYRSDDDDDDFVAVTDSDTESDYDSDYDDGGGGRRCRHSQCEDATCSGSDSDADGDGEFRFTHCGKCHELVAAWKSACYCHECCRYYCESCEYVQPCERIFPSIVYPDELCRRCLRRRPELRCDLGANCDVCSLID